MFVLNTKGARHWLRSMKWELKVWNRIHGRETLTVQEAEAVYGQLIEHTGDRLEPEHAVNRATDIIAKYYLGVDTNEETPAVQS